MIKARIKNNLVTREGASTPAKENSTRNIMIFKVNNPRMNHVVVNRRDFVKLFKIRKEFNKVEYMLANRKRAKVSREIWKNFRVMKSFQHERRRVETLKESRGTRKSRNRR